MFYLNGPEQDNAGPITRDTTDWPVCSICQEPHEERRLYQVEDLWLCSLCDETRLEAIEIEEPEPDCTCTQTDVDLFDARGCEFHDSRSDGNVRQRSVGMVERYEGYEREVA